MSTSTSTGTGIATGPTPASAVDGPLTVSITRRVAPEDELLMQAWVHAGTSMAERFEGFLGAGWVRSGAEDWHMLYRFDSRAHLDAWERSPERMRWLRSAADLVEHRRTEYRTGIEGWFDEPATSSVHEAGPGASAAPPRWKQASVIWIAFFPTSLALTYLLSPFSGDWPAAVRVLVTTLVATPWMTYVLLPFVTRLFGRWLKGT
ncbi:antibiotic biosynthesis monooxygenase [Terrabacter tumescens]|uniref:Antibiotic biosynthesis monooxygenase n=1 Tax=Terrabacter tumescens TaxID=60443 RepID=A0ABQ2HFQ2_9MICO|nr:antibiotic biosynthesis monooxygenase [Terrabacter tumescens]GGM80174.1 antibiotic biosynthesis monooxygenase [Terrabacter tumescens]